MRKLLIFIFLLVIPLTASASSLAGRILLQVEQNGEAFYFHPESLELHFLGRPDDAFKVMREQGIGISNANLLKIEVADTLALKNTFSGIDSDGDGFDDYTELINDYNPYGEGRLSYDLNFARAQQGKIFLQVENNGEAWYINPVDNKRYFLGRPADAFEIMRTLGLGISNRDLLVLGLKESQEKEYSWIYDNKEHSVVFNLSEDVFKLYNQDPKLFTYYQNEAPDDLRAAYYEMFLNIFKQDSYTMELLANLRSLALTNNYLDDKELEYVISFIQYLEYDFSKAEQEKPIANFPYETLYLQKGICTDTSFLAYLYAKELGYGVAILDFPESNHAALGIKCPLSLSLNESGYCFVETTNYFPLAIVPSGLNNGQASLNSLEANLFSADNLGLMEIRLAIDGKSYQGVETNMEIVESLKSKQERIRDLKLLIDDPNTTNKGEIITEHNELVTSYNQLLRSFYQISI